MTSVYDFKATTIDGDEQSLADYKGKAMLIVNVASKCGFTPQYKGLEDAVRKIPATRAWSCSAFPCDQFGHQEPGDEEEIKNFCSLNYDVKFPLFAKIDVNGANTHPLYKYLKQRSQGPARQRGDQVELHQVPGRQGRQGACAATRRPIRRKGIEKDVAAAL